MGLFDTKKKTITFENPKCRKCGRRIKDKKDLVVIDGETYCRKCGEAERDWDRLIWLEGMSDD